MLHLRALSGFIFLVLPVLGFSDTSFLDLPPRRSLSLPVSEAFSTGCSEEAIVRPGDTWHLRQTLKSTPEGCTIRISGNYIVHSPLIVRHRLVSAPATGFSGDGGWFTPLFFTVTEQHEVSLDPLEDSDSFYFQGVQGPPPKTVIKPVEDYFFTNLVILEKQGSLEHIGLDNRALPLTETRCRTTGLALNGTLPNSLEQISLSTILNLCLPESYEYTVADLPNVALSDPEDTETNGSDSSSGPSNTAKSQATAHRSLIPSIFEATIISRLLQNKRDKGDDDDDPDRQKELQRSHYSDDIDWEERLRILESGTVKEEKRRAYLKQYQRTYVYQRVGSTIFLGGVIAGGFLLRRYGVRGALSPPWPDLHYRTGSNGFRSCVQAIWVYVPGLIVGAIAQGPLTLAISIPKRMYIQERLADLEER